MNENDSSAPETSGLDFIRKIIAEDIASGKHEQIITRFPPEPNGYLHIGHAKAITISFSVAQEYGGYTNLRFDDTNPVKEEVEYIEGIKADIHWLGFEWKNLYHASDYFETLYEWAVALIEAGYAYVCDQSAEEMKQSRGTLTEPGVDSPWRERSVEENLSLFREMRGGKFPDGSRTLRAKIDMAHPNLNMRDPVMYRILHKEHPHRGADWCIYPTYDWTHGQSDSIENITHSLCSLEFEAHRPLYDWFIDRLVELKGIHKPRQIEFARLDLTYTVMSKRKLLHLVQSGLVRGWDDPRMPTLRGLRRRGVPPEAIRLFIKRVGVAKANSTVDLTQLEHAVREVLNETAPRRMAVLNPLKVTITNYPMDEEETLDAINNPEDPEAGSRKVPFSRELYIERDDFMEAPPKKFFRLAPGREVRLRYAYFITCDEVVKDASGEVVELKCTYDPETRGGDASDGRKVKGTLHWVSAQHAVEAEVRLYEPLFSVEDPDTPPEGGEWTDNLNPDSLQVVKGVKCEPSLAEEVAGFTCQFERKGYFALDADSDPLIDDNIASAPSEVAGPEGAPELRGARKDESPDEVVIARDDASSRSNLAVVGRKLVFNRTATLRDSWAKLQKK